MKSSQSQSFSAAFFTMQAVRCALLLSLLYGHGGALQSGNMEASLRTSEEGPPNVHSADAIRGAYGVASRPLTGQLAHPPAPWLFDQLRLLMGRAMRPLLEIRRPAEHLTGLHLAESSSASGGPVHSIPEGSSSAKASLWISRRLHHSFPCGSFFQLKAILGFLLPWQSTGVQVPAKLSSMMMQGHEENATLMFLKHSRSEPWSEATRMKETWIYVKGFWTSTLGTFWILAGASFAISAMLCVGVGWWFFTAEEETRHVSGKLQEHKSSIMLADDTEDSESDDELKSDTSRASYRKAIVRKGRTRGFSALQMNAARDAYLEQWMQESEEDSYRKGACPNLPELKDLRPLAEAGGIVPLIEKSAKMHPGRSALIDNADGSVMTYKETIATVQTLAQQLRNAGVDDGDIIALLFKPCKMFVVAALGVMKAGAIWMPLDADSPPARLCQLLELAGARLGLGFKLWDEIMDPPIWTLGPDCLLSSGPDLAAGMPALPAMATCPAGSAAVFFTSGSTGTPKGVIYGHETVLHGAISMSWLCSMTSKTVSLLKTPPYWAVIEYEMFPALVAGGTIVCDSQCQTDPSKLSDVLMERRVTVLMTSDQVLRLLVQGAWKGRNQDLLPSIPKSLAHVVNVGGQLSLETCAEVSAVMPHVLLHNVYGCTESACTQWTYTQGVTSSTLKRAPAGRPQPGSEVYIVDANLRPVPQGQEGEICFGGPFLSYGYLGDHVSTEARFVHAPHLREKVYRTGDVGRWIEDPASTDELVLEVVGRVDRQLNLRGVRVAPEEIEAILIQAPGVEEAAVVAANNAIVAYLQSKTGGVSVAAQELCSQKLAASMRPVLIRQVVSLPLLRNGKVDLAALARRAADDLKQNMVEAVDSLGMMQRVSKGQIAEFHTLAAARGLATAANLLWHWYWVFPAGEAGPRWQGPSQQDLGKTIPSTWLQILLSGFLSYDWTTQVFIMASAYTERKTAEQGRNVYPRQELFTIVLYLALWWPFANLFTEIQRWLGNTYIECSLEGFLSFRWYLAVYLMCRLLHRYVLVPLEESFASLPERTAHAGRAFFASSWWVLQLAFGGWNANLCPGFDPNGYAFKAMEFILPLTWKGEKDTYCAAFFHPWLISSLALYVSVWFYGTSLVAWAKETPRLKRLGPLPMPWTAIFLSLALLLGHPAVRDFLARSQDVFYLISCFYSVVLFMALAQWSDGPWLRRTGLAWSGHASLGTYCFHMYFLCNQYCENPLGPDHPVVMCDRGMLFFSYKNERIIPSPAEMMQMLVPYGGVVQLFVLLAYFFFFTLLVGMPLQFVCLKVYSFIEQSILHIVDVCRGSNKTFQQVRL